MNCGYESFPHCTAAPQLISSIALTCAGRKLGWVGLSEFIPREWKRCSITFASFHGVAPLLPLHVAVDRLDDLSIIWKFHLY